MLNLREGVVSNWLCIMISEILSIISDFNMEAFTYISKHIEKEIEFYTYPARHRNDSIIQGIMMFMK